MASKHISTFTSELESEIGSLQTFIEILKKEEAALVHGDIDAIDKFTADKSRLVEQLVQFDDQRNEFLRLKEHENNIDKWLEKQQPNESSAKKLWHKVLELAKIAKQLNDSNGLMISTYLQHNQRALTILRVATGKISLYGPKGQAYI